MTMPTLLDLEAELCQVFVAAQRRGEKGWPAVARKVMDRLEAFGSVRDILAMEVALWEAVVLVEAGESTFRRSAAEAARDWRCLLESRRSGRLREILPVEEKSDGPNDD
jgi:hypothetical protein